MQLKSMDLQSIKPYENNPRINDQAVDAVIESIRQCGYIAPIIVDENNIILAGHTRYKALKQLKHEKAEVIVKKGLTEDQKRKYRLLDNKTSELAEWDFELLGQELEGLDFGPLEIDWGLGEVQTVQAIDLENAEVNNTDEPEEHETMHCPKCGFVFEVS